MQHETSRNRKTKQRLLISVLCTLFLFVGALFPETASAATFTTFGSSVTTPKGNAMELDWDTVKIWRNPDYSFKTYTHDTHKLYAVKLLNGRSASSTFNNIATFTWEKVDKIGDRYIDLEIDIKKFVVNATYNSSSPLIASDNYVTFARIGDNHFYTISAESDKGRYRAKKRHDITFTFTWSDTGEIVDLPFYHGISDMDAGYGTGDYIEAWQGGTGYASKWFRWPDWNFKFVDGVKIQDNVSGSLSGNDSWYKGGIIAPTTSGQFSSQFWGGDSGTDVLLFNQYSDISLPTKTSDMSAGLKYGDTVTFTIKQKIGNWYSNTYQKYDSFVMNDILPEGLSYESAVVKNGAGTNITSSQGTLTYDDSTRTVSWTASSSCLSDTAFYNGQTLTMTVTTKVTEKGATTITNKTLSDISSIDFSKTSNITVVPIEYQVRYNGNGADGGSTATSTHQFDVAKNLTANGFSKTGYKYVNWNLAANGLGTAYSNNASVVNLADTDGAIVDMYAQWDPIEYTIKYNANGATGGTTADSQHVYDTAKNMTQNGYSKTGYKFTGWNTQADGSGTSYADQSNVLNWTTEDGKIFNLYAQWEPIKYTIRYDGNGATAGSTQDSQHVYDVAKNMTKNGYSKTGYTFGGWTAAKDGTGTSYTDQQSVINLSNKDGDVITVYAKWIPKTDTPYKVLHWKQNVDGNKDIKDSNNYTLAETENLAGKTGAEVTPSVKSYSGFKAPATQTVKISADGNTVVNYYYTREAYTVTVIAGAGISSVSGGGTYLYEQPVSIDAAIKEGYTWGVWAGTYDTDIKNYKFTMPAQNVTETATGDPNEYTVTYHGNGHTAGSTADSTHKVDIAKALTANGFTKDGYKFKHWTSPGNGTGTTYSDKQSVVNLTKENGAVIPMYAQWEPIKYTIKYDANGATSGSTQDSQHVYNTAKDMTKNGYSKTGYIFNGWNSKPDGSGTAYEDQYEVLNWTKEDGKVYTVYAQWTPIEYKIIYDINGGDAGTTPTSDHIYDKEKNMSKNQYTKKGYTFGGWNSKPDGSGKAYTDQQNVINLTTTNDDLIYVYAQWEPIKYTVKYHGNGNTGGVTADSLHYFDVSKALTENAYTKKGYTFLGWNTKEDGSGKDYQNKQEVINLTDVNNAVIDLYAKWAPIEYTITYDINGGDAGTTEDSRHVYDKEKPLTQNGYEKTGYIFNGWNTKEDGSGTPYTDKQDVINLTDVNNDVIKVYAQWEPIEYTIKYHGNGNTSGSTADSQHVYDVPKEMTPNGYEKTGYIFNGWNTKEDGSGDKYSNRQGVVNLTTKNNDVIDVYAQWDPIEYEIKYDGNGATEGNVENSHHIYDQKGNVSDNKYSRPGGTFLGWNSKPDGSGDWYSPDDEVFNWTTENGKVITLYAQWDIAGKIKIIKRIDKESFYDYHGDATFIFKVISEDGKNEYFTEITFTKDDMDASGAAVTKSAEINDLPLGEYTISEVSSLRYDGSCQLITPGEIINSKTASFEVEEYVVEFETIFQNTKIDWSGYSHNDLLVNKLKDK